MFAVIFEVHPKAERWDEYLGIARLLRPEIEKIDGFVDNIRYRSLTRPGWLLSLSSWRDEKALVRWRTQATHHGAQEKGRFEIFHDYHLRIGQITADTHIPDGQMLREQRLDATETGAATTVTLADASLDPEQLKAAPEAIAHRLGLAPTAPGRVGWDVFEAILTPGDAILLQSWKESASGAPQPEMRHRQVRIIRDYGMEDRREAPQYYPPVARGA